MKMPLLSSTSNKKIYRRNRDFSTINIFKNIPLLSVVFVINSTILIYNPNINKKSMLTEYTSNLYGNLTLTYKTNIIKFFKSNLKTNC